MMTKTIQQAFVTFKFIIDFVTFGCGSLVEALSLSIRGVVISIPTRIGRVKPKTLK
jgi:hypothetical protein